MVLEQQGATSKGVDAAFRLIAKAVAMHECRDEQVVRKEMLERIAIIVGRAVAQRIRRRIPGVSDERPPWVAAAAQVCATELDEWQ